MRHQFAARVTYPRAMAPSVQQVDSKFALQAAHSLAQRWLGDVQLFGGTPERAKPGYLGEVLELLDPHSRQPYTVFRSN